ncbi:hypothetical protein JY493_24930 [Serratia marcescens]|nr:hypothetical protein [Serratia marcescens]
MSDSQQISPSQEAIIQIIRDNRKAFSEILGLPQLNSCRQQSMMKGNYGLGDWDDTHVWIEPGYNPELRVSLASYYSAYLQDELKGFWVPIYAPDGNLLVWLKFSHTSKIHGAFHFAASEIRLPNDGAPELSELVTFGLAYPTATKP